MTADTSTAISTDEQYRLVYNGIAAVAANCDGAIDNDGVGFNGQDTKFGKRIASVPFSEWTDDIKAEAARIATTYRAQIERYIGVDITTLPVVRDASEHTNRTARDQARGFENLGLKTERKARLIEGNTVVLSWHRKDPDCFGSLLTEVKRLPGRRWTGSVNEVDLSIEALDFIERNDVVAEFDVDTARTLVTAQATQVAAQSAPAPKPNVVLDKAGVRISFPYDAAAVSGVRRLPGRSYDGSTKTNTADLHPEVLAFADEFNFTVDPAVVEAIENLGATKAAVQTEAQIRRTVSALADPAALPADFAARVLAACPKAKEV